MSEAPRHHRRTVGHERYEMHEALGSGGMATVYRATDTETGRACAVKVLAPHVAQHEKTRSRFLSEAHTMASLDHPNIVRVFDVGEEEGDYYFVMELAAGGSLSDLAFRKGARRAREAMGYVLDVLAGLEYAHLAGVIHRDIKPHNMLLDKPPSDATSAKLTDFGIALNTNVRPGERLTGTGDTLGTLAYMSPEQRTDPRDAGPESDLYGVGASLYLLVTGRRPFDLAVAHEDAAIYERVPEPLRDIVRRSTMPLAAERYRSAREMADALTAVWASIDPEFDVGAAMGRFAFSSDTLVPPRTEGGP